MKFEGLLKEINENKINLESNFQTEFYLQNMYNQLKFEGVLKEMAENKNEIQGEF